MAKTFALINSSLLRSKKLKGCDHNVKWAYLCAHLTPLSGFSGLFEYPLVMWAQDADIPYDEFGDVLAKLCEAGLIEYDKDDELLRIISFHRQRPPENASRAISLVADFTTLIPDHSPCGMMRLKAVAEFVVATIQRAQGWRPNSPDWPKLRDSFKPFLANLWKEYDDTFLDIMRAEITSVGKAAQAEIHSLFPVLEQVNHGTLSTPCPHPARTLDVDETRRREDENKDLDENKTMQISRFEPSESTLPVDRSDLPRIGKLAGQQSQSRGPLKSTLNSALVLSATAKARLGN
ncbi:MAG: hypothetical protein JKY94_11045 [Rhodobacteraceae bacterium]|nr:hypothetical protein [Paracoccaceae bacterium]